MTRLFRILTYAALGTSIITLFLHPGNRVPRDGDAGAAAVRGDEVIPEEPERTKNG